MSNCKKAFVALLLSFMLILGCAATAFADPEEPIRFSVTDGTSDLSSGFKVADTHISGTVPFETAVLYVSVGDSQILEFPLTVGTNALELNGYQFLVTRETPSFVFSILSATRDYSDRFTMSADRQISGSVPHNVEAVYFAVALRHDSNTSVNKTIYLQPGTNNDSLDLQIAGTNYHFNFTIIREEAAANNSFTVKTPDGTDISGNFTLDGNKLHGKIPNETSEIVVSISSQGYSDNGGITYAPEVGTNNYTHEIVAGSGTIIFYLSVEREEPAVVSEPESEAPVESVTSGPSVDSEYEKLDSEVESHSFPSSVPAEPSSVVTEPESEPAVSEPSEKQGGGNSILFWIALALIFLGILGVLFVILDTLYTYGILKKWIFRAPIIENEQMEDEDDADIAFLLDSTDVPLEEASELPNRKNSDSADDLHSSSKTPDDDWDGFFRNK